MSSKHERLVFPALLLALFASGVAALVNQVVWQRALKIQLGGSEALSSMAVVFVFILGLSLGSALASRRADSSERPLLAFAKVEVALGVLNAVVAIFLATGSFDLMVEIQAAALSIGVPLRVTQWLIGLVVLILPCTLMGATQPLAAAALQRQASVVPHALSLIVAANTAGSVLGAWAGGFELLPRIGQVRLLLGAAAINLLIALGIALVGRSVSRRTGEARADSAQAKGAPAREEGPREPWLSPRCVVGFVLGFASLGYEMLLFRGLALAHGALPTVFAAGLVGFLLTWTVGATLARFFRHRLWPLLLALVLSLAAVPWFHAKNRALGAEEISPWVVGYLVPCVIFGILYGAMAERGTAKLGERLGRYAAMNTAGCCAGVLFGTLVLYEMFLSHALALSALIAAFGGAYWIFTHEELPPRGLWRFASAGLFVLITGGAIGWSRRPAHDHPEMGRIYSSRDGVIEVRPNGNVFWDGLWHAQLAPGWDYRGSSHWLSILLPALAHEDEAKRVLIIGLGTGITVASAAEIDSVESVVVYDLNARLEQVHRDHPDETWNAISHPKVDMRWREARTGLALEDDRYDIVAQQPLYLKQAGSSALLSKEYFELVKPKLNPGGIFCIYSNAFGNDRHGILVRDTARRVFSHTASFNQGYLLIVSDSPIDLSPESIRKRLRRSGGLYREASAFDAAHRRAGGGGIAGMLDDPPVSWDARGLFISDDQPLVEYPKLFGKKRRFVLRPLQLFGSGSS